MEINVKRYQLTEALLVGVIASCMTSGLIAAQRTDTSGSAAATAALKQATADRTPDGHPDLQGVGSFAVLTPLERPDDLADKAILTEAEAAEVEQKLIQ